MKSIRVSAGGSLGVQAWAVRERFTRLLCRPWNIEAAGRKAIASQRPLFYGKETNNEKFLQSCVFLCLGHRVVFCTGKPWPAKPNCTLASDRHKKNQRGSPVGCGGTR